ncbi:thiamine phosphate synthase [Rubrivirga marina]|uniref:Thiamine-phosphate synthase n=1 Tax=Rubrivirga marina TaxID=1196024 RepID=A0A271J0B4_9BACT|nr:thiamine phosphate synthase [Rubrivirga marina]PAP76942.1 thiamine-phosphate diphosphorylase [Rubrivirga marina]
MPTPPLGRLHVLTDTALQTRFSHAAVAGAAIEGGADTIQFRQKSGGPRDLLSGLLPTVERCHSAGVPCLVDDHLDLALAAGATGVHLGQTDLPVRYARAVADRLGEPFLVGATATTAQGAAAAEAEGADYVGFGPVFPTASKANPASVKGLDGLRAACEAVSIPVVAIAGITPERVGPCLDAGAWGVAVLSAVTCADDPAEAAATFRAEIDRWLSDRT